MEILNGIGVSRGLAMAPLYVLARTRHDTTPRTVDDVPAELARFSAARDRVGAQLEVLHAEAVAAVGEQEAMIFEVHRMMLDDPDFTDAVTGVIESKGFNAEHAVFRAVEQFAAIFTAMDDAYMQARAADVRDIGRRLLGVLCGGETDFSVVAGIVAADDLAPSETVRLNLNRVAGFVTSYGSTTSHTAILARTRSLPAVVSAGRDFTPADHGRMAVADGETGQVWLDPTPDMLEKAREKQASLAEAAALLAELKGKPDVTRSGCRVDVFANIGHPAELDAVHASDAGGIGLFRTEFLYLEKDRYPTEDALFAAYKDVAKGMAGKRVIIRTLDIGADKQALYFNLPKEENPALGCRAVRLCLKRPELFRTQLRAILRASAFGNVAVMTPMIINVDEVRRVRALIRAVQDELHRENAPMADAVPFGIMIETPAAALISDLLAPEVDFFSIGTNDLIQYTLAVDRQNRDLAELYNPRHPAVLRLVGQVVENACAAGIWTGICGDMAADLSLTQTFADMGVTELSVSPGMVLPLRHRVRECA